MRTAVRVITGWNVACPVLLATLLVSAKVFQTGLGASSALDIPAALLSWAWLLGMPVSTGAALVLNTRFVRSRPLWVVNGVVFGLWLVTFALLAWVHA